MTIRLAEERDLPAIVAIYAQDELRGGRERVGDPLGPHYHEAFRALRADPNQRLFVAEIDGQVVGTLQMSLIQHVIAYGLRRAVLEALFVASAAQGRGIGSALIDHAVAEARAHGCRSVELTSNKQRDRAHGFYERHGFRATHEGFKRSLA